MSQPNHRRNQTTGDAPVDAGFAGEISAAAGLNTKSPFDFGVDFDQVQKRRDRARKEKAEKAAAAAVAAQPLMSAMDVEDESKEAVAAPDASAVKRPSSLAHRAKTTGADMGQAKTITSFFGFANRNQAAAVADGVDDFIREPQYLEIGPRKVAIWPYDDYHLLQKAYYERLKDKNHKHDRDGDESKADASRDAVPDTNSIPIFQRPNDPPDIPTAVQGLPLTEFERKAEERSIAIVSTWLFDAGLIDELLVNGGIPGHLLQSSDQDATEEQGVEIGAHGFAIEGSTKMDKEIAKLRNATQRQLALINARLNDGVAATGSEVQELVNLVTSTKDDIGRLRELTTYISNPEKMEAESKFMLANYPRLKQTVNARRNLARCFRELDFFAMIPSTCDRLREELHAGEWTAHEWTTLRSVCREHVELEIFLVEAEAAMKERVEAEEAEAAAAAQAPTKQKNKQFGLQALRKSGIERETNQLIDMFLHENVENVWELGDEIRLRIMSGIAASFDLAINNPAGMVALVEAVEVYETANEEYKAVHGYEAGTQNSPKMRFTDMRAVALGELYKDFENRGLTIFSELIKNAADIASEDNEEVQNKQFSAVLRACNELTSEVNIVKEQMAPCFPPSWRIPTLWTTCVAHVCSNNILQQIGGPDGQKLPDLTVTQLLDLVAWVETFREIIEETFPHIASITVKRTYFEKPPQLLAEDGKSVDLDAARDSLAWVNNIMWDVYDLAKDEFLFRIKEQTEEWLNNVYDAEHTKSQTAEGRLVTSLCEDVFSIAGVQLRTIQQRLTRRSEALVQAVGVIFKNLYEMQVHCRDDFCNGLEECCGASNDFVRMSDKCEEIVQEIQDECNLSPASAESLEEQTAALLNLYSGDAVYAAQKTHVYCFEPIEEELSEELFSAEWLDNLTHNESALTLVRTLDDFMVDLEMWLDEVMVQKTVEAQITSSIIFYLKMLVSKSATHKARTSFFSDNERALQRMRGDMQTIREYFTGQSESMPTLTRVIEREFTLFEAMIEIMAIASGSSSSDIQDFIFVMQKSIRNVAITKFVIGDLYHLVNPADEYKIYELIDGMENDMTAVAPMAPAASRSTVPGLRIDQAMAKHIEDTDRKRPLQAGTVERAEQALKSWRLAWGGDGEGKKEK